MGIGTAMEPVTSDVIRAFLQRLSERFPQSAAFYLLGGSALCLLGSSRETRDIDYTVELPAEEKESFQLVVKELAREMRLDLEDVPLGEFIPLPPAAMERHRPVGRFGQMEIYIFDLYSIALSKIARGFEADLEDVMFMLDERLIEFALLEELADAIQPNLAKSDVDPKEFCAYFEEIRGRVTR
jgi:hypothetical protein